jgi:serum/glucocorticoid-regulated kinase 2
MAYLDQPFIVKMHYAFESRKYLVFVLEYCSGGELFYLLRKVKRMSEEEAFFYFAEICLGMKHLHDNNIVYRDIKPENILIDFEGHVRIADFGLSKPHMEPEDVAYSFCGSPEYMAPEMLLKSGHNFQLDLYCLGALLFELITGLPPYYSRDTDEIYNRILN